MMNNQQIPFHQPVMGDMQFFPNNVPPVQINCNSQELMSLVPEVTASVLNTAFLHGRRNIPRTYFLNTVVQNNFMNQDLQTVVDLVMRLAVASCHKDNRPMNNVRGYIPQAVEQLLAMYCAALAARNQHLMASLDGNTSAEVYRSNQAFAQMVEYLKTVHLNGAPPQMQQQYQQNQQQPAYGQPVHNNQPAVGGYGQPLTAGGGSALMNNYQPQFNQDQPAPATTLAPGSQWGGSLQPQPNAQPQGTLKQGEWFEAKTPTQPASPLVVEASAAASPMPSVSSSPASGTFQAALPKPVTIQGGSEMDYQTHALVYLGSTMPIDLTGRSTQTKLHNLQLQTEGRQNNEEKGILLMDTNLSAETSIDDAIFAATAQVLSTPWRSVHAKVFRKFVNVLQPVAAPEGMKDTLGAILNSKTDLKGLALGLRSAVENVFADRGNPQETELNAFNVITFLDRRLTVELNRYLKHGMGLVIKAGSFSEDYPEMPEYLRTKFGPQYRDALMAWEAKYFDHLKSNFDEHAKEHAESFFNEKLNNVDGAIYLPSVQSVTLLGCSYKELGFKVDDAGSIIDPKLTPNLFDIAESLRANKRDRKLHTTIDWIVTSDGYRFMVAEREFIAPHEYHMYPAG